MYLIYVFLQGRIQLNTAGRGREWDEKISGEAKYLSSFFKV